MEIFQILDCSSTLGNCCSDYGLVGILSILRKGMNIIQIIVPIILIVMVTIQFVQMIINPPENSKDKQVKSLTNKFVAAVLVFFLPLIVNITIDAIGTSLGDSNTYSIAACWTAANTTNEILKSSENTYISSNRTASRFMPSDTDYENGSSGSGSSGSGSSGSGSSSSTASSGAQRLIDIATAEIGNNEIDGSHNKYESYSGLSSSDPWCAAFVTWCAGQAGYLNTIIPSYTAVAEGKQWFIDHGRYHDAADYTPQPGDIIFFGTFSHTGIVVSADANNVYTIEGNTSGEGEAAGVCSGSCIVSKKTRARNDSIAGYGNPAY